MKNMITSNDVLRLIEQEEGTKLEWKDSRILDNPFKLAKSMTAMANQDGGIILIGVKDDGTIEGMKAKKGHQEHIMTIATDRCEPPITPVFQRIEISREADVYALTIPKRRDMHHGVKTKDGLVYFIRVGSRIREMRPYELGEPKERGVKIEPYTPSEKGLLWLSEKTLMKVSTSLNLSLMKGMLMLIAIGVFSIAGALLLIFRIEYGKLVFFTANYPWWISTLIFVWLICGIYLSIFIPTSVFETRCPACKSFFAFEKVESEILEKRTISEDLEEWKVRNLYRCKICKYENEETKYEEHSRE
jgi:hypothetical protein